MIAEFIFFGLLGLIGWAIMKIRRVTKRRIDQMDEEHFKQEWYRRDWN